MKVFSALMIFSLSCAGALQANASDPQRFGLLVMAHGGSPEWNRSVLDAVAPLHDRYPVEVAFGMADACSLQVGVSALEAKGVRKVGVVRLFVSGESWYERTEQILGVRAGAPPAKAGECHGGDHGASHHSMALFQIETESSFVLSKEGLAEAPEIGAILAERAAALSRSPEKEDVLILAHGPGDDAENRRWLAYMEERAAEVRKARPFHLVAVMTLREDWPDKRKAAEEEIRALVTRSAKEGRNAIVLPFRLSGFGPYAGVLEGLEYRADRTGFLPHENVTRWITRQADALGAGPFQAPAP